MLDWNPLLVSLLVRVVHENWNLPALEDVQCYCTNFQIRQKTTEKRKKRNHPANQDLF